MMSDAYTLVEGQLGGYMEYVIRAGGFGSGLALFVCGHFGFRVSRPHFQTAAI